MAAHAAELFAPQTRALTHCNAGGLATGGYGSAVGALLTAWERGLLAHVWVDETRPLLQGARLTAWELETAAIPHTVIADSAAASLMAPARSTSSSRAPTGSRRTATPANKIGTYSLAVLARHHGIPFYVVAPTSTVDLATRTGAGHPDRGARSRRDHRAVPGAQPGLRRHAGRPRSPRSSPSTACTARRTRSSLRERGGVKAIILAAGYATRLRPLTDDVPKPLLPVGGRPILDWILANITEVDEVDEIHVVTNSRFAWPVRPSGGPPAAWSSTTTARVRTRTGSERSATSSS
jgi:hypothetical protein